MFGSCVFGCVCFVLLLDLVLVGVGVFGVVFLDLGSLVLLFVRCVLLFGFVGFVCFVWFLFCFVCGVVRLFWVGLLWFGLL